MIETLLVPGLNGSPAGHWQHHWASTEATAELVEQENWTYPHLPHWLAALEARIAASAPGVILVAHSLGCALVSALVGRPSAEHVGGALLVAPVDLITLASTTPGAETFLGKQSQSLPFASIVAASRNDPYLSYRGAERQAAIWGSALWDLGQAGHVNIASGFGPWPDAITLANGLRGRQPIAEAERTQGRSWFTEINPRAVQAHGSGIGAI